ncbi:urea-proton symporter DUR3-like [Chlorella sorokiniana]|uniref:Urea-proton symporter DUR3-like n=1 Tax=Chlorella sorokiniana TaxID=3076 RepID=A0A2P6TDE7_CHLSO|nr:urea-proton symporter DUR3-like [Chlorella sorokiniana]|eukprot:PRW20663.1 urea-proton symporter DUR3-like [Chlorella sorokiniana]
MTGRPPQKRLKEHRRKAPLRMRGDARRYKPFDEHFKLLVLAEAGSKEDAELLEELDYRYGGTKQTSEQFTTAGRPVKTGLIANVVVSEWTWAATLLQSSNVAWQYGVTGSILGGLMWFSIPFTLATSLGLAAVALDLPITSSEAAEGLVPPAMAVYILGKSGTVIMLFMAVTSTGSAELIAASSLFSYDLYRTYLNPKATGKDIIRVSRYVIVGFGLLMGVLAIILFKIGLSLGWVYLFMGIAIGGAGAPIYMALVWKKANANGTITGAICGLLFGITAWLVTCRCLEGRITIDLLGGDYPMLAGNLTNILSSLPFQANFRHKAWNITN